MRVPLAAALLVALVFAGCITSEDGDPPFTPFGGEDDAERRDALLADAQEFCGDEADCDFWDTDYHEYVVYDLDTVVFDVVIVPPAGMTTPDNIDASRLAVQAWRDGILHYAEPWLAEAFEVNVYAVGIDIPSLDAIQDPEIIVLSTSAVGILGIGLEPKQIGCAIIGGTTLRDLGGHTHGDNEIFAEDCTGTGFTCFAINGAALDPRGLYDLIAHEVGHCLGAGHVGDALDFRARYAPIEDIMSYQDNETQVHCVSNLNVRTLQGVYAHLLGRPEETFLPAGSYHHMDPLDYEQVACENPPGM